MQNFFSFIVTHRGLLRHIVNQPLGHQGGHKGGHKETTHECIAFCTKGVMCNGGGEHCVGLSQPARVGEYVPQTLSWSCRGLSVCDLFSLFSSAEGDVCAHKHSIFKIWNCTGAQLHVYCTHTHTCTHKYTHKYMYKHINV